MSEHDRVRQEVSKAYAEAVADPEGGCCGGTAVETEPESCCGGGPVPKGAVARIAGYTREQLEALPEDAATNAFGCGNPVALAGIEPGQVVLDLGSGAGIDILLAGKKVGESGRVIGVDMTDEMIARATENVREAGLQGVVELRKGIIEELPVEDASVDWVISNCVINLSPEKARVFAEIARVLRPGGRMLVSDIVVQELPEWVRESRALYCSCVAGAISEGSYLAGLRDAGLVDADVTARLVYEPSQLAAFVDQDMPAAKAGTGCCGSTPDAETLRRTLDEMQGKVWSARFLARKPG